MRESQVCPYFSHTVFKGHDHSYSCITVLYKSHQSLVISSVHLVAVYREYHVTLPHTGFKRRPVVLHVVHICYHLYLLLPLVMYPVTL